MIEGLRAGAKALAIIVDTSAAANAAHKAYEKGASIPECIDAFAKETDGEFDDQLAADLTAFLEKVADTSRTIAIEAVSFRNRLEQWTPTAFAALDTITDTLDRIAKQADTLREGKQCRTESRDTN